MTGDDEETDRWRVPTRIHRKVRARIDTATDGPVRYGVGVMDAFEGGLPSARYLGVMKAEAADRGAPADRPEPNGWC